MGDAAEWSVADHLRDKPAEVVDLYERFVAVIAAYGPFTVSVAKSAITFKGTRRGFAGAKPRRTTLDGYLDLQRRVRDNRILRASPYTASLFVHQFRIAHASELDETFAEWVGEAYQVGQGAHLRSRPAGST